MSADLGLTQDKVAELQSRMDPVVRESVNEISNRTPVRLRVLRMVQKRTSTGRPPTFHEIVRVLSRHEEVEAGDVAGVLFDLRAQGRVDWDNDEKSLAGNVVIRYVSPRERGATTTE